MTNHSGLFDRIDDALCAAGHDCFNGTVKHLNQAEINHILADLRAFRAAVPMNGNGHLNDVIERSALLTQANGGRDYKY